MRTDVGFVWVGGETGGSDTGGVMGGIGKVELLCITGVADTFLSK